MKKDTSKQPMRWAVLTALAASLFVIVLDGTLMNVSISAVVRDLNTTAVEMQSLITIYSLVMAAFMLLGAKLGDVYGHKKMFILGVILFGIGAGTAAIAPNTTILMLGWSIIEGLGAALMMPATLSLMMINFEGKNRALAFGVWGGVAAAGAALGPIIGGFFTDNYSWRVAFALEVGVILLVIFLSRKIIDIHEEKKISIDWIGAILSVFGLGSLVLGLLKAYEYGWFHAKKNALVLGRTLDLNGTSIAFWLMIIGLIISILFVLYELKVSKQGKDVLLKPGLFKIKGFVSGVIVAFVLSLAQAAMFFTIPLFLQIYKGYDAMQTGLVLLPMTISVFLASVIGSRVIGKNAKVKPKHLVQVGLLITLLSAYIISKTLTPDVEGRDFTLGFVLFGTGMGLVMSQLTNLTLSSVDVHDSGDASGINSTLRRFGSSLGTAIIGTIMFTALTTNMVNGVKELNLPPVVEKMVIEKVQTSDMSDFSSGNENSNSPIPPQLAKSFQKIFGASIVSANKDSLFYMEIFVLITFGLSFLLPKTVTESDKK